MLRHKTARVVEAQPRAQSLGQASAPLNKKTVLLLHRSWTRVACGVGGNHVRLTCRVPCNRDPSTAVAKLSALRNQLTLHHVQIPKAPLPDLNLRCYTTCWLRWVGSGG